MKSAVASVLALLALAMHDAVSASDAFPESWTLTPTSLESDYTSAITSDCHTAGHTCLRISNPDGALGVRWPRGQALRRVAAAAYRGKRLRFGAVARAEVGRSQNAGRLRLRVLNRDGATIFKDSGYENRIKSAKWKAYAVLADIGDDADSIELGLMLFGRGTVWFDAVEVEILGPAGFGDDPPRPLTGRRLDNLMALTRLLGYVRYFHPDDRAAHTDWDQFTIRAVTAVEPAANRKQLVQVLQQTFRPVAPTVRIALDRDEFEDVPRIESHADYTIMAWRHYGSPQRIDVLEADADGDPDESGGRSPHTIPDPFNPNDALVVSLGRGLKARVPHAMFADGEGTLPRSANPAGAAAATAGYPARPDGWMPNGNDRATRLAAVMLAWNRVQHFYPYFDAIEPVDWDGVLRSSLRLAATDRNEREFIDTLRRLLVPLQDGHGNVSHRSLADFAIPPVVLRWVEQQIIVTHALGDGIDGVARPGDAVVAIDGVPADRALTSVMELISSATRQFRLYRAIEAVAAGPEGSRVRLTLRDLDGQARDVTFERTDFRGQPVREPRPPALHEIRPGIFYVSMTRAGAAEFEQALPRLTEAESIVFDLRGYPRGLDLVVLARLTDSAIDSPQLLVPLSFRPDRRDMRFISTGWDAEPQTPKLTADVVFLIDERCISAAETVLGMVEHYGLGQLVGSPTAGTNGGVARMSLPGQYVVSWTGVKVLKHDGSQHHGVGILPTVPVSLTRRGVAAGRDEILERGIEVCETNGL